MSAACTGPRGCGKSWGGTRAEHCTECHETFTGTTAGDKHRVGDPAIWDGPKRRRCLTVTEMTARGMATNDRGVWTNGGTSPWATKDGAA